MRELEMERDRVGEKSVRVSASFNLRHLGTIAAC